MNAEELIQSLIDDLKALMYPNERSLTRLRMRSKMIIRRVFGDSSKYLEELEVISFPPVPSLMEGSMVALNLQRAQNWDSAKLEMLALFESMQEDLQLSDITKTVGVSKPELKLSNRIFVVHGHDGEMKESVARMLQKLGLDPIILHEKASTGRTIIEKIERNSDVGFAVVLLSPDDKGCTKSEFSGGQG